MGYPEFAPYVFTKNGVLDFTKTHIQKEAYTKVLNKNQELTKESWDETYHRLYNKADEVVYGNNIDYCPTFGV